MPLRRISQPKGGYVLHGSITFGMPSRTAGPGHRATKSGDNSPPPQPRPPFDMAACQFAPTQARGALDTHAHSLQGLMVFLPLSALSPLADARKEENTRSLLNDKREVVAQRQRYEQYSVVVEEVGTSGLCGWGAEGAGRPRAHRPHTPCRYPCSLARACPTAGTTMRMSTTTPTMATRWALMMRTQMMSSSAAGEASGR